MVMKCLAASGVWGWGGGGGASLKNRSTSERPDIHFVIFKMYWEGKSLRSLETARLKIKTPNDINVYFTCETAKCI